MQHGGAGEVTAGAQQQHLVRDAIFIAGPMHDRGMRPRHPFRDHPRADRPGFRREHRTSRQARQNNADARSRSLSARRASAQRDRLHGVAGGTQSHITRPSASGTSRARWPMAKLGLSARPVRPRSSRQTRRWLSAENLAGRKVCPFQFTQMPFVLADRTGGRRMSAVRELRAAGFTGPEGMVRIRKRLGTA